MFRFLLIICFFVYSTLNAQTQSGRSSLASIPHTIEIEIKGRPTWQKIIPLGKDGLLLFVKKDITKAIIAKFDADLKKIWESEVFLDVEKQPSAYTLDNEQITFMFSENQGMYYQIYIINLKDGKFENKGFELREFFQDQSYVHFKNRVLVAGMNEKTATFYDYDFQTNEGNFISADLTGKAQLQYINHKPNTNVIESLWSIKESAFTNEKKKKGEFIKNAFVVYVKHDTLGKLLFKTSIQSNAGNFPLTAQLTVVDSTIKIVTGIYQSNTGIKGVYFSKLENDKTILTKFYDYRRLLNGIQNLSDEQIKKISKNFILLPTLPVVTKNELFLGGSFYLPNYQVVTVDNPNYVGYDINSNYNTPRTKTKQVLSGYNYVNAFTASFDLEGNLITQKRIELNQTSSAIDAVLAINKQNVVALCDKGVLSITNPNSYTAPNIYKLSAENGEPKNAQYIPRYRNVRNWYDNYFIADGSRIKFEVVKEMDAPKEKPSKRKKGKSQLPETNIKKIIYLTKILGAEFLIKRFFREIQARSLEILKICTIYLRQILVVMNCLIQAILKNSNASVIIF